MLLAPQENLLEQVLAPENLNNAWQRVRSNKGAPGIDGLTIEKFVDHFRAQGKSVVNAIKHGCYSPYPVKRVYIEKESGGLRGLGIPTVFDRVIQQAIVQILTPIFDPTFSESSFGFRPNKSQHFAVKQVQTYIKQGRKVAVDVDLSKFFDRVNHDLLMTLLGKRIHDKSLPKLIAKYLRAGSVEDDVWSECREGVPLGFGFLRRSTSCVLQSKVAHYHHCYQTLCSTFWTKSLNTGSIRLLVTRMILSFL